MKYPLRILIVEDSEDDALLAMKCIEKGNYGIEYEIVQTAEKMKESLKEKAWDIILSDYHMPRFSGFEALEIFKQSGLDIPFIIISGTIGEEIAVECMKAGADDYLMKGHLKRLLPAVERGLREAKNRAERKRLEEEQKRAEAKRFELERELIQSQKFESLGTLASGIAHDFNNILAIILGFSSLGEQGALTHQPELIKCFETISLASRRGALLVGQLLTFARKTETVFRSTDVNALITEITTLFGETFPKTIGISPDLQKNIPPIVADVTQLHQVFMNLCVNARDAMPTGGTLTIATRVLDNAIVKSKFPKAAAQRYMAIGISDTGSGMDENTKRKIFDPFFTTKEPGKGTGLGLALVHSIIENHHGMIEVESEPGKGTVFHLYLPIEESDMEKKEPAKSVQVNASGGTETVLLIEDEVFIIDMVRTVLTGIGYAVLIARDGEEGVAIFSRHQKEIKAVVLDFGLPKLRGDEVASRIKTIDPKANIVLISGFFDPEIRTNMARIGVNRLIQKPFSFAELTDSIRSVIDAKS
jgi:two-component system, cell cycle sensor histidine kinase and response regulator CckA